MDHRIARSIIHPDHIDGAFAIHANSRTVRVAHRVRQRLRQESQSAIGGSAEQYIGVVGGIILPHHIDVPGCVHRSLRSHREIAVVRHVLCCGEWQLRLRADAHGQQTQKCYGGDLAEAAGVNHETLLKRSTNKIWISSAVRFKNGLNCLWPVVGGLRNWRILRLLLGTLALGDDEKQAQLTLRSVVKTPERKGKLKYYVSKVAPARTRTRCRRFLGSVPNRSWLQVIHSVGIALLRGSPPWSWLVFVPIRLAFAVTIAPIEIAAQEYHPWKRSALWSVVHGARNSPPSRRPSAILALYSPPARSLKSSAPKWIAGSGTPRPIAMS